jgi:hypothetical protein
MAIEQLAPDDAAAARRWSAARPSAWSGSRRAGPPTHLYKHHRLDADGVVEAARELLNKPVHPKGVTP